MTSKDVPAENERRLRSAASDSSNPISVRSSRSSACCILGGHLGFTVPQGQTSVLTANQYLPVVLFITLKCDDDSNESY